MSRSLSRASRTTALGCAALCLASLAPVALAATYHVSTSGSDRTGDGSLGNPWRTVSRAAAAPLLPGDRVSIAPGAYAEDIALTRSGAQVVPVTPGVAAETPDLIRFPVGTDLSGLDLGAHPDEYFLYLYRSWRGNGGVFPILEQGSDADGPWVRLDTSAAGADLIPETGAPGDLRYLSAAIGRPIVFRNAAADPETQRVVLDASSDPGIYTVFYIGGYLDPDDAIPADWNIVDGIDVTGSHQGGGYHIQDSSFNVVMNARIYDLQSGGILIAGNSGDPARYNLVWKNRIWNTPYEGVYVGAGGHGPEDNHAYYTHVIGNDISVQGTAPNAALENAVDLKEYNYGDLVAGNLIHDFDLVSPYNGAIDIRNGKQDVLVYGNTFRNLGKDNGGVTPLMYLYGGSRSIYVFNNLLDGASGAGSGLYAFGIDGGGSSEVLIAHNTVKGFGQGILLEHYSGTTDVTVANNLFDFGPGGTIEEWGNEGRFTFSHNLYTRNPGAYPGEPARLIADPQWLDPTSGDYRPDPASPAVDSAADLPQVAVDMDGRTRPSGLAADRGAYELPAGPQPPHAAFAVEPASGTAPLSVVFEDRSAYAPSAWAWDFGDGAASAEQHPSHVYTEPGSYSVSLTVSNANGSDTLTRTGLIEVAAPGRRETIFADGFENGLAGWYKDGAIAWYAGEPKIGTHAVRFTRNNVWFERSLSTAGFAEIRLSVYMGAKSFENREYLILYWYDGQTWHEPIEIDNTHPASDGQLHRFDVDLPASAANNPDFAIAFGMWNTDRYDYAYLDEVLVTGVR